MTKKIMITGATGFVGRHLVNYFIKNEYAVRAIVREATHYLFDPIIEIVPIGDIGANTDWIDALKECDTVIHSAARVHVMRENAPDPLNAFRLINVGGTLNLARQAAKQKVRRFIFLSSIKVNGETTFQDKPFGPEDTPNPQDPYSISKYEAEQGLLTLAKETSMEVVIIRPPLIYGPAVKGNFFRMMKWISSGIPLPFGHMHNQRSFVSIYNLADCIKLCIHHPLASNQIFLVSDGDDLSTTALLQKMGRFLGKNARILPIPILLLQTVSILIGKKTVFGRITGSLQADITKTQELLGWKPIVSLEEGLINTAEHYLQLHECTYRE